MGKREQNLQDRAADIERAMRGPAPQTAQQIADAIGLTLQAFRPHLARLRELRRAYVAEWRHDPYPTAYFALGSLEDAVKPTVKRTRKAPTPPEPQPAFDGLPDGFFNRARSAK